MTNGDGRAWQVLYDLSSWQVTQIPRHPHSRPVEEAHRLLRQRATTPNASARITRPSGNKPGL